MNAEEGIASIELTVGQSLAVAEALSLTWPQVLAVTPTHFDPADAAAARQEDVSELEKLGLWSGNRPKAPLRDWASAVCRSAERWYEVRCLSEGTTLRGVVAQASPFEAVTAYRHAQFVVLSGFEAFDTAAIAPAVLAGLGPAKPADVPAGISFPTAAGTGVDEKVRSGATWEAAVADLGLGDKAARWLIEVAKSRGSFIEVTANCRVPDGLHPSKKSVAVFDTGRGRVLVRPNGKFSEVLPGDEFHVAVALDDLAATTPLSRWFERSMTKF